MLMIVTVVAEKMQLGTLCYNMFIGSYSRSNVFPVTAPDASHLSNTADLQCYTGTKRTCRAELAELLQFRNTRILLSICYAQMYVPASDNEFV